MRRGFTLLESIIVVTLLGLVGLSFGYLASLSQRLMIQGMNSSTSQGEVAFALEHIKRHLTIATAVTTPAAGDPAGDVLVFTSQQTAAVAARTSSYDLINPVGAISDLRFTPDTTAPGVFEDPPNGVIARGIQSITFTRGAAGTPAAGTISVDVTAQKTTGGNTQEMRLQTNVSPRGLSS
ncbi:MAG: type II secretion system protein [Candidatus Omnitrophota bacterium]|nr:type II secretion system protein [Candidatus Omnitrophota bacterium]